MYMCICVNLSLFLSLSLYLYIYIYIYGLFARCYAVPCHDFVSCATGHLGQCSSMPNQR